MANANRPENQPQDDDNNLVDLEEQDNQPQDDDNTLVEFEAKVNLSPKGREFLETTIAAGKTIVKVGRTLIPLLLLLGMALKSCTPETVQPATPTTAPITVAEKP
jgi:hypothetical protein